MVGYRGGRGQYRYHNSTHKYKYASQGNLILVRESQGIVREICFAQIVDTLLSIYCVKRKCLLELPATVGLMLTLEVPIMTAADDKFFNIFPNFGKK